MNKRERFAALAELPDDGKVLIEAVPAGTEEPPNDGDLFDIANASVIPQVSDDHPAFGVITPNLD
jgi:hypothetical protein